MLIFESASIAVCPRLVEFDFFASFAFNPQAGAKVNISAGGATPLHIAADSGNLEIINSLLQAGADPNAIDEVVWSLVHGQSCTSRHGYYFKKKILFIFFLLLIYGMGYQRFIFFFSLRSFLCKTSFFDIVEVTINCTEKIQ